MILTLLQPFQDQRCYCCRSAAQHNANTRSPGDSFPVKHLGKARNNKQTVKLEWPANMSCISEHLWITWKSSSPPGCQTSIIIHPTTHQTRDGEKPGQTTPIVLVSWRCFHKDLQGFIILKAMCSNSSHILHLQRLKMYQTRMALGFHEDGRTPKWKFLGVGDVCFMYFSFFPSGIFSWFQTIVFKRSIYPASFKITFAGQLNEKLLWINESFLGAKPHKLMEL